MPLLDVGQLDLFRCRYERAKFLHSQERQHSMQLSQSQMLDAYSMPVVLPPLLVPLHRAVSPEDGQGSSYRVMSTPHHAIADGGLRHMSW